MPADLTDLEQMLNALANDFDKASTLTDAGLLAEKIIKTRTRAWRDVEGRRFQDYSEGHKKKRIGLGLAVMPMGKNVESMLVMDSTDGMMQKVKSFVSADLSRAYLRITDPAKAKLMYWHSFGGVGRVGKNIRHVWGLSDQESTLIAKSISEAYGEFIAQLIEELKNESSD